jgi:hypothetical protein
MRHSSRLVSERSFYDEAEHEHEAADECRHPPQALVNDEPSQRDAKYRTAQSGDEQPCASDSSHPEYSVPDQNKANVRPAIMATVSIDRS